MVEQPVDAGVKDDSTLHNHTLCRSVLGRTDADSHTEDVGAGSTLLVGCSPLGCTPLKEGTWGPAAAGIRRS